MERVITSQNIASHIRKAKIVQVGGAATGRQSGDGAGGKERTAVAAQMILKT